MNISNYVCLICLQLATIATAGPFFGMDNNDILNELRGLSNDSSTPEPNIEDYDLLGANVELKLGDNLHSLMEYVQPRISSAWIPLATSHSKMFEMLQKYCHLFGSLRISIEFDGNLSGERLAHYINTYCPSSVRQEFSADGINLHSSYAFEHVTGVTIHYPEDATNFRLHQMFPGVEKLTLYVTKVFRFDTNLPNLTAVTFYEQSSKQIDLRSLARYAPRVRSIGIGVWWKLQDLQEINLLFPLLEGLHILFRDDEPQLLLQPALLLHAPVRSVHFPHLKHFSVDFSHFNGPFEGCVDKLSALTFNRLESMGYISSFRDNSASSEKLVDWVTQNTGLTSVSLNEYALRFVDLITILKRLPALEQLILFSTSDIDDVIKFMRSQLTRVRTRLQVITVVGDDWTRDAFLSLKSEYDDKWTLQDVNPSLGTLNYMAHLPGLLSLTFVRAGPQ